MFFAVVIVLYVLVRMGEIELREPKPPWQILIAARITEVVAFLAFFEMLIAWGSVYEAIGNLSP